MLIFMFLLFLPVSAGAKPRGKLIIFHAGSLAIPFKEMSEAFTRKYPEVKVYREASGSRTCARKITDLKKPCDVMASADYTVIDNLLLPDYADWNISFATNEMAIMFRKNSAYAKEINGKNWHEILLKKGVEYGHSDPNCDPCGYRSQLVWQLAEKYYQVPGLYKKLRDKCPKRNVRPKETDLIALLEAGQIDYLFMYRSVCEQHQMPFVILPEEINLKSAAHEAFYKQAVIKVTGKRPGEFIKKTGKPMVYGITVPKNALNKEAAIAFVAFVVGPEGQAIMRRNGQPPVFPPKATGKVDLMPVQLKKLVK
ncbi:MAG: tungstate ABC transporter substrate-binding protein WtpA [Deltaproteobacteria bacterium]|nr:tungstate ABC transporter substrate-binding protein WtpA [Deltaproteobacteria bacterium]